MLNVVIALIKVTISKSYMNADVEGRGKSKLANSLHTSKSTKTEDFLKTCQSYLTLKKKPHITQW
jgi:hypothetical protein